VKVDNVEVDEIMYLHSTHQRLKWQAGSKLD
jgi:hypothetical protein